MEDRLNDRRGRFREYLVFYFFAFVLVAAGNWLRGAHESGLGSFDDEPSHVVTGLLVADFVVADDLSDPMAFAKTYYLHYPKVALGQWPPVFYCLIAAWVHAFGATVISLIGLMTALTAAAGTLVYATLRREDDRWTALTFAAIFLALPLVQKLGSAVMTEVPLALFGFGACLAFVRFLETRRLSALIAFGALAVASIMTKGNGLALMFVPLLAIALTRSWDVLKRPGLWGVGLGIGALTMPWYLWTLSTARGTWEGGSSPSWEYVSQSTSFHLTGLFLTGGLVLGALGVLGLVVLPRRESRERFEWAAAVSWLVGVLAIHALVPSSIEARHQVLMLPAFVVLAGRGFAIMGEWLPTPRLKVATLACVPVLFLMQGFGLPVRHNMGFRAMASELLADARFDDSVFLIASDPIGEGLFITAVALTEERPGHVVLRGTKVLARSDWMGRDYTLAHTSDQELTAFMKEVPVGIVVIDHSCPSRRLRQHQNQLYSHVRRHRELWQKLGAFDVERDGEVHRDALEVYRQVDHEHRTPMVLDPEWVLGRALPSLPR